MVRAVVQLAERAGALLAAMQSAGDLQTRAKSDGSPVTLADVAAHDLLAATLPQIGPYPVVSEESGPQENADRLARQRVWIVDPLDGTRGYLRGSAEFTVNIALVEDGIPILGVIAAPRLGLTYYAEFGAGAYRSIDGAAPERIACACRFAGPPRLAVSSSDRRRPWSAIPILAGARIDSSSSSAKLGFIADGRADVYPRLTPCSEWDIAAGHAIVAEAGGRILTADGRDVRYNRRPDPIMPPFLATGIAEVAAASATILGSFADAAR